MSHVRGDSAEEGLSWTLGRVCDSPIMRNISAAPDLLGCADVECLLLRLHLHVHLRWEMVNGLGSRMDLPMGVDPMDDVTRCRLRTVRDRDRDRDKGRSRSWLSPPWQRLCSARWRPSTSMEKMKMKMMTGISLKTIMLGHVRKESGAREQCGTGLAVWYLPPPLSMPALLSRPIDRDRFREFQGLMSDSTLGKATRWVIRASLKVTAALGAALLPLLIPRAQRPVHLG